MQFLDALSERPPAPPRSFYIQGVTADGKLFRPSDWAERLAGALSTFRPRRGPGGIGAHIGYSPYCFPTEVGGVKAVIVSEALRDIEPKAWDFIVHFARDNGLALGEVCVLPEERAQVAPGAAPSHAETVAG